MSWKPDHFYAGRFAVLVRWGCAVWTVDDALLSAPMQASAGLGLVFDTGEAVDVCAPESHEFLDDVNRALGTSFELDQFAGR